jgi:hypothetical protein
VNDKIVKASKSFKNEGRIVLEGTPGRIWGSTGQPVASGTGLRVMWDFAYDADGTHTVSVNAEVWSPMEYVAAA